MSRAAAWLGALALAWAGALGCASTAPRAPSERRIVHTVERGETIYAIAKKYDVSVDAIVAANRITDFSAIEVGTRLLIPKKGGNAAGDSSIASLIPFHADLREQAQHEANLDFDWPIHGHFSSGYGWRGIGTHEGIDLTAKPGTPVLAAEAGRVIESGWRGDYGRVVVVKHARNYSTLYAHNRALRVKKGAFVEKGDVIAEVGSTGNATGPHLHFEIRRDREPADPLRYLPAPPPAIASPAR